MWVLTNRTTDGDHLKVAGLQPALQLYGNAHAMVVLLFCVGVGARRLVVAEGL